MFNKTFRETLKCGTIALWGILTACTPVHTHTSPAAEGGTDSLAYARHFEITRTDSYKRITIFNPWNNLQVLDRIYLVRDSLTQVPSDGLRIQLPIRRLMIASASHIGYIEALGLLDRVVLCPDTTQIYSPALKAQVRDGQTAAFGDPYAVNTETILHTRPDLIMMIGYAGADQSTERLRSLNQPVVCNVEWTEPTILGRAEWIKLFGALFDLEALADSVFDQTAGRYHQLCERAQQAGEHPKILPGHPFRGTWYMPGGQAGMARMFADAGGSYAYSDRPEAESVGIDFETVVRDFWQADLWIGADARSMKELLGEDSRFALLKPVTDRQVYNNRLHTSATGGNLYWETTQVHPDWLLEDLIRVLHPGLLPEGGFHYLQHLQ
ncbi:MAG: ABC transporter substrate-binding protein [Paludibacteraceae bacterium]|nr:ABC transporter substrate-binding protein [Paludibacteraceae bacterium]